jgi:hypothetical protein
VIGSMSQERYSIIFSSATGNTEKLAEALRQAQHLKITAQREYTRCAVILFVICRFTDPTVPETPESAPHRHRLRANRPARQGTERGAAAPVAHHVSASRKS